jgi:RNA polymerase sigma-70 factor (ECF subfamily)
MDPPHDLERLYDEHASALFAFLLNFTRSEADTRDTLQDVFLKLARRPGLLDDVTDVRAFLLRLAHNRAVDLFRRRRGEPLDEAPTLFASTGDLDAASFRDALTAALAQLPADQRAVVHLKLWEGLTFEAIAATLDIPSNTAASRYRYGLDKLRDHLRPIYEEITRHG